MHFSCCDVVPNTAGADETSIKRFGSIECVISKENPINIKEFKEYLMFTVKYFQENL